MFCYPHITNQRDLQQSDIINLVLSASFLALAIKNLYIRLVSLSKTKMFCYPHITNQRDLQQSEIKMV